MKLMTAILVLVSSVLFAQWGTGWTPGPGGGGGGGGDSSWVSADADTLYIDSLMINSGRTELTDSVYCDDNLVVDDTFWASYGNIPTLSCTTYFSADTAWTRVLTASENVEVRGTLYGDKADTLLVGDALHVLSDDGIHIGAYTSGDQDIELIDFHEGDEDHMLVKWDDGFDALVMNEDIRIYAELSVGTHQLRFDVDGNSWIETLSTILNFDPNISGAGRTYSGNNEGDTLEVQGSDLLVVTGTSYLYDADTISVRALQADTVYGSSPITFMDQILVDSSATLGFFGTVAADTLYASTGVFGGATTALYVGMQLDDAGTFNRVDMYIKETGASTTTCRVELWSSSGGTPNALVASSDTVSLPNGTAAGFHTFSFDATQTIVPEMYLIVHALSGSTTIEAYKEAGTGSVWYSSNGVAWTEQASRDGAARIYTTPGEFTYAVSWDDTNKELDMPAIHPSEITTDSVSTRITQADTVFTWDIVAPDDSFYYHRVEIDMANLSHPTSNPPAADVIGLAYVELFDAASDEQMYFDLCLPEQYADGEDIIFKFVWAPTDNSTNTVTWGIESLFMEPDADDSLTAATATDIVTDDSQGMRYELLLSPSLTIDGTSLVNSSCGTLRCFRDADASESGADDDYAADAALIKLIALIPYSRAAW